MPSRDEDREILHLPEVEGGHSGSGQYRHLGTFPTKGEATKAKAMAVSNGQLSGRSGEEVDHFIERWVRDYPRRKEATNR